ncbi:MAG: cytidylate kinase-like family protein [Proteobacteria bacterium]|nr:cytidylate kinase-like family protein [Pseudomonadota bacterium]
MHIPAPKDLVEKAVKRFQLDAHRKREGTPLQPRRVITVSRQLGSGGKRVTELLSTWLDWPVWDKEILDVLASQSHLGYQAKMFEAVDEKVQDEIESLLSFTFGHIDKNAYQYLLPKAILLIAQHDAVIIGRGAHLFLPESIRVRIKASFQTRVENIMHYEGINKKTAQEKIRRVDKERESFMAEIAHRLGKTYSESKDHLHYDLEINTDRASIEEAALLILIAAIKRFKLAINLEKILKETRPR